MAPPLLTSRLTIPPAASINAAASNRKFSVAAERGIIPFGYGRDRVHAMILNIVTAVDGTGSRTGDLLIQCLWGHSCSGVGDVYLNNQDALSAVHYYGDQTTPDPSLVAAFDSTGIRYSDTLAGYSYSVVRMPIKRFAGQLNISAEIEWVKVYDPRKDSSAGGDGPQRLNMPATWAWSNNPVLCTAHWFANTTYGPGRAVDWASVPAAADFADERLGGDVRRALDVTFADPVPLKQMADTLAAYCGCWLVPTHAGIKFVPDRDEAAVASYSHAAGNIGGMTPPRGKGPGDMPTVVEVVFKEMGNGAGYVVQRDGVARVTLPGAGSTLPWRVSRVRMPGINRYSQAYREAVERLNKLNMCRYSTAIDVYDIGIRHQRGDIIDLTHPIGFVNQKFRVVQQPILRAPGRWRLMLTEHSSAAYSEDVEEGPFLEHEISRSHLALSDNPSGLTGEVSRGVILWAWDPKGFDTIVMTGGTSWYDAEFLWQGRASTYAQRVAEPGSYTLRIRHIPPGDGLDPWVGEEESNRSEAASFTVVVTAADIAGTFYQEAAPTSPAPGDVWTRPSTGEQFRWNGAGWDLVANIGAQEVTLIAGGAVTVAGNTAVKADPSSSAWDAQAYSRDGYTGGAYASAKIAGGVCAVGLSYSPSSGAGLDNIDFAIHFAGAGVVRIVEGGVDRGAFGAYTDGNSIGTVTYDGHKVRYYVNGALLRTADAPEGIILYADTSFHSPGSRLTNIRFGPLSSNSWSAVGGVGRPSDYASADLRLTATTGVTIRGNAISVAEYLGDWDGQAYTTYGYVGGAFAQATAARVLTVGAVAFGLSDNPSASPHHSELDYAIALTSSEVSGSRQAEIWESGTFTGIYVPYAAGDVFAVTYDGSYVKYWKNGTQFGPTRQLFDPTRRFFFGTSINGSGDLLRDIRFGPMSSRQVEAAGQLSPGVVTAEKLSVTQLSAITGNLGTINAGVLRLGSTPNLSGTGMTGTGAILQGDGTFAFGNATRNIQFNGSTLRLNGVVVSNDNIEEDAVTKLQYQSVLSSSLQWWTSGAPASSATRQVVNASLNSSGGAVSWRGEISVRLDDDIPAGVDHLSIAIDPKVDGYSTYPASAKYPQGISMYSAVSVKRCGKGAGAYSGISTIVPFSYYCGPEAGAHTFTVDVTVRMYDAAGNAYSLNQNLAITTHTLMSVFENRV